MHQQTLIRLFQGVAGKEAINAASNERPKSVHTTIYMRMLIQLPPPLCNITISYRFLAWLSLCSFSTTKDRTVYIYTKNVPNFGIQVAVRWYMYVAMLLQYRPLMQRFCSSVRVIVFF